MADGENAGLVQVQKETDKTWEQPQSQAVEAVEAVKSTAMVKSARKLPVYQFSRLDRNTDLHRPPDNWLRSEAQLSKTWVTGECTQFSSFAMAETLPDTVGEVDVISAAENIKKLLKIPFSKAQVSMAVHCVGKTLLLDELDLFKHLRSASQRERDWMKTFLIEAVLSEGKSLTMKRKTNELLQKWNLLSKFLYYSIGNSSEESVPQQTFDLEEQHLPTNQSALIQIPDLLPKTKPSEFARQALWQFEDIRMLIGTDLPIFGEGIHPAVSLRLKDMSSPINVLTGLDYWLDNLMSNVPELAMCYHLNGIVQKYELLKTEEIPNLEDANFAPQVVKDVAQNILSFLKSHCTKEGHTYWLFKGQDEDVVKLYDLTSLCNEYPNRPWENPFISPVAMLLYRVARNLSMSGPSKKDKSTIYKLLKNCLQLLEGSENHHPEVAASASHLLSHVFINEDDLTDPPPPSSASQKSSKKPQQPDSSSGEDEDEFVIEEDERKTTLNVPTMNTQNLMLPSGKHGSGFKDRRRRRRRSAKTVFASKEEKAKVALMYVVKGLQSITECSESTETTGQKQKMKMPSPLPSPTRVRPLCYPEPCLSGDSQGLTGCTEAKLKQLQEGPGHDQQLTEETTSGLVGRESMFNVKQPGKEQMNLPVSAKTRSDSVFCDQAVAFSLSHVIQDKTLAEIDQRSMPASLECDSQTSDHQVLVPRSSDVIPVAAFSDEGSSGEVLGIRIKDSTIPVENLVLSQFEDSSSSGQTADATPLTPLQEQSDHGSDDSSSSFERLSWLPAAESEVLLLPTDSSVAARSWHPGSWQHKLNFLLLKKAWEIYLVLSKAARDAERYGWALHLANMSLLCRGACQSMKLPDESSGPNLLSDQLTVCGDCLILLTHNLATYVRQREEFQFLTGEDRLILNAVRHLDPVNKYEWAVDFQNSVEHNLRTGILCYTLALSEGAGHADDYVITLTRKQGNARNELGVYYMNQALTLKNEDGGLQKEQDLWRKSLSYFESGIEIFENVNDVANVSLLLCNIGKLMRLCAFSFGETELCKGSEMTQRERYYYNKATDYYQRALSRLGQRKKNPSLWESVTWELSSTYFAMATILQDHPPLSSVAQEQVEKDIIELMNKALILCEVDDITPAKQPVYHYRAATIHHRLASMHHNAYRNQSSQQKQKYTRSLAELHYQKAVRLFQDLDRPSELLRVLLEKVALSEHQFEGQSGVSSRIKTLHSALEALLQCKDALSALHRTRTREAAESHTSAGTSKNANKLATDADERKLEPQELNEDGDFSCGDGELSNCKEADSKLTLQEMPMPRFKAGDQELDLSNEAASLQDGHLQVSQSLRERLPTGNGREAEQDSSHLQAKQSTEVKLPAGRRKATEQDSTEGPSAHKLAASESVETGRTVHQDSKMDGQGSNVKDRLTKDEEDERQRLESMWESRLQYVLLNLVKLHSANKKGVQHVAVYKKMYATSLGRTLPSSSSSMAAHPQATTELTSILEEVQQLFQSIK